MIFQCLGIRMSFQAKKSSNLKQTTQSFQTRANSAECLLSAARPNWTEACQKSRWPSFEIRRYSSFPPQDKSLSFILNFNQKINTFDRKFWLLLFFFPELCQYQNRSHQPFLMCQLVPSIIVQGCIYPFPFPLPLLKLAGNPSDILSLI